MKKLKLFLENFLVYGLGGIISQIIPLIMVPIVTRIMPNSSYLGISDMSNTLVSFFSAIAVFGMYDAMYRMFFENDEEEYRKKMCSTAFFFNFILSMGTAVLMVAFSKQLAQTFFQNSNLSYLVYIAAITTLVSGTNTIVAAPTRMQNKRRVFLIMNTIGPALSYSISIPLLLSGHYIVALPIAGMITGICNESVFVVLNKKWFTCRYFQRDYLKQLLSIAIPLFPNFLVYWIFSSSDRLMITNLIGTQATGLYSVGSKLGAASQLVYIAFAGGWQYFAFSTMKDENQVESNSRVFEYLGIISFAATTICCLIAQPLYSFLFTEEYKNTYIVSPYLFLAPLLQMLFQVIANQFLVVKKTWPNILILSFGALTNVILNLFLIPKIGIEGAAIATLIGYTVSDIICSIVLCKMKLMSISREFLLSTGLMVLFFIIWRLFCVDQFFLTFLLVIICIIIWLFLYKRPINKLICLLKNKNA